MPIHNIQLLPRSELDEFGQVLDFIEYVSETFPLQTDVEVLNQDILSFVMHNYTEVVGEILDAKMRKIFKADPRITYTIETGLTSLGSYIPEGRALVTVKWPHKKYRTKRTLSVYANIDNHVYFYGTAPLTRSSILLNQFVDVSAMVNHIEMVLRAVPAYNQGELMDLSNTKYRKGWKTGVKHHDKKR